ncbi:hypothetical protein AWB80_08242 [Caballeronia pedi]|uniref:Uncharacterized protein n=1 Tax=Caballeronia pedi TaxID=1777141 RepID=A0A158E7L4_9BURK|nr:hypothetical protein [Caballeronia pedi]SAL01947.1 hypothetical protein AWB80_08242 [Caballeronia pedi]
MSIIGDLCSDLDFKAKAEQAVKAFFEDNYREEIHGKHGGMFDADVTKATVTLRDITPDTVDGLSATVAVSGEVVLEVQYMDEEGDDQEMTVYGSLDGSLSIEFPSQILAFEHRYSILLDVEIAEADVKFSPYDSEEA